MSFREKIACRRTLQSSLVWPDPTRKGLATRDYLKSTYLGYSPQNHHNITSLSEYFMQVLCKLLVSNMSIRPICSSNKRLQDVVSTHTASMWYELNILPILKVSLVLRPSRFYFGLQTAFTIIH